MNYLKNFLLLTAAVITVILGCNNVYAAQFQYPYQFDDVSGTSGIGSQWVGFLSRVSWDNSIPDERNSIGGPTTRHMPAGADLLSNTDNHYAFLSDDHRYALHALYLVIPEGIGTLSTNFKYSGSSQEAIQLGVYGGNFETSYPSIVNSPTPGPGPTVNVDLTVQKREGERTVYDSRLGEIIFHQDPDVTPSQTLHVPFVIANVHDGPAQYAPLELKVTTRSTSGDIVGVRWFNWDAAADRTVPANADDWIFVPIVDPVIDRNEFMYDFTTEITNHTGWRYGLQRYDDLYDDYTHYPDRTLFPSHWKFDLQPISDQLHNLPPILELHPMSHIPPGLVAFYSHNARVTAGQQKILRLAAVGQDGSMIGSKLLTFQYRTVYGYALGSVQDTSVWTNSNSYWGINAFRVYPSGKNFLSNVLRTMEIANTNYFFPSRASNVLAGTVENTFPPITADALSSFTMSAPVPFADAEVLSKDAEGNDVWVPAESFPDDSSAMIGANVILRIPRANRFITEHWDSFAASENLANDFARYFSLWFRSPEGIDLNLTEYLKGESKYDRTMKVFIDEENECITVNYITLFVEQGDGGGTRRPKIRIVSDTTSVNDYDYMVVNDGVDDGKWDLTFFVMPNETTPPPSSSDPDPEIPVAPPSDSEGGGGCSVSIVPLWMMLALIFVPLKRGTKVLISSILLTFALCLASCAAVPELVIYEHDAATTGTLRYAVNRINNGTAESNIILMDYLNRINITEPIELNADMDIDGNGALISGSGTFRLFKVTNGAKVNFRNMTFTNGSVASGDNGGAVLVENGCSVYFDKCTFTRNEAAGYGGAVYSEGMSYFTNCTFFRNYAGSGGAVFGSASSVLSFSFVTMNSNECSAVNGGHAVNAAGGGNVFQASVIAGNGSSGAEIICSPSSRSLGYNVFEDSTFQGAGHESDFTDRSAVDIFGSSPEIRHNEAAPGWGQGNWPYTLALLNNIKNPAMGIIPASYIISTGVLVDQRFVVRANGSRPASAGSFEIYDQAVPISSLEIGGIPNGIATIGFTAQLRAYVLPADAEPGVMWRSDDPSVVAVTPSGRVYSVGKGITLLWAFTTGFNSSGERISKSFLVEVGEDEANSNIPPELANMIDELNNNVWGPSGVRFNLSGSRTSFSDPESFYQKYGKYPSVINPLPAGSNVSSNSSVNASEKISIKPSVRFSALTGTTSDIGIVPFVISVSLSAKEISDVIGNSDFSVEEFFQKAAFCTGSRGENILIDNGSRGIGANDAANIGILSVTEGAGNVTLTLSGWFADADNASSVVDGQLIVTDRNSDESINSEIWLITSSGGVGDSSEESSGGCNSLGGGALFILMPLMLGKRMKKVKRKLLYVLFSLLICFNANAAFGDPFTVSLNYSILPIVVNQPVFNLIATPLPEGEGYSYRWSTDDTSGSVLTLTTASGAVVGINGVGRGRATVICEVTSSDNVTRASADCVVTVFQAGMSSVFLVPSSLNLAMGVNESGSIQSNFQPIGAEPISYTWSTDDPNIVSVDNNGNVLAKSKGSTIINYTAIAIPIGGGDPISFDAECPVTVSRPLLSIDISQSPSSVMEGRSAELIVSYFPPDADSIDIAWSLTPANPSVVSIDSRTPTTATFSAITFPGPNPTVYPNRVNPVLVTASSVHWSEHVQSASREIIIDPVQISNVSITPSAASVISRDERVQFTETVMPANATRISSFWDSSNPLVASVSESGLVVGLNQGEANISFTFNGWLISSDGTHLPVSKAASSPVIIASPVTDVRVGGITIEPTTLRLPKGASFQMVAEIFPYNAANKNVNWDSDNRLVASVNANGLVTALNPGTARILAIPADRGIDDLVAPAVCELTVYDDNEIGDDPAYVRIPSGLRNKIEEMNAPLKREGLEVNFGFLLNKPREDVLTPYAPSPVIIPEMDELSDVKITLAQPVETENIEAVASSAEFEVDVSSYNLSGLNPILPVSLKMTITENILQKYLPQYYEDMLTNPRQHLNQLFGTFSFQKQIVDIPNEPDAQLRLVPLFIGAAAAVEAENLGIISLRSTGDKLEITLNYYVADSGNTAARIVDDSLIIGDGTANGIIHDPVWITVRKVEQNNSGGGSDEGGGGCSAGLNIGVTLAAAMVYILRRAAK